MIIGTYNHTNITGITQGVVRSDSESTTTMYCPNNCRWSDRQTQAINKRVNGSIPFYGVYLNNKKEENLNIWLLLLIMARRSILDYLILL